MRYRVKLLNIFAFATACFFSQANASSFVIGYPEDDLSSEWRAAQMRQIEGALANYPNVRFIKGDANGSVSQNILEIENMVNQGAQLLFLAPRNPDAVQPLVKKLRTKGVKIILLTRKLNSEDYDVYISPDDYQIAYKAANLLAKKIKGKGNILMLEGIPSTTTSILRTNGFLAGIKAYPGIHVIRSVANYSSSEAIFAVETVIDSGQRVDAIFAQNDAMATGSRLAVKKAGIAASRIPIVGIDFIPEARKAILAGEQFASFTYPLCGLEGVKAAMDLLHGKPVPRHIVVPSEMVTKENVETVATTY